jgi:signal transduction histidine kinase
MIIGMVVISLIYAVQSYATFQINAEHLVDSVAVKNEAIATNMIQRLELFIDKRIEEFKTLERAREIRQILKASNEQFSQINDLENFLHEKTIQNNYNRNLPFIIQAIEEKSSDDLTSIIDGFDQEFGYDYADEFFITNSYGASIVLVIGQVDYNQSDKEWWHNTSTDRVHVGHIQYNKNYDNYSIPIVIRIYDDDNTFLGTIRVLIDVEKMISEFVTNSKILENQKKYAMLLANDGRIIYSDHIVFDQERYIEYGEKMVGTAGHFVLNSNSEKTIVSFARPDYESNGLGWVITISERELDIVESLGTVINLILLPSLIGIILIIIVGGVVTVFVSRPLNRLAFLSSSLAKGNFDVKANVSKIQEIKTISRSFNELSQSLKKLILTEKALAESKIKIRNERLFAIGELSASMAHDLKNPLAVIKASSDILKRKFGKQNNDDKLDRLFYNMDDAVSRMSHQIKNVLDYVRITPLETSDSSLKKIIHNSIKSLNIPKNITMNLPKKDLTIKCDVRKIEVVFINLILNAIQAIGKKNDGKISILTNDEDDQNIMIEVQNTGDGIPEELLSNVFDPLFTTKYQGTGLGLSTCKNVIKQHGGSIYVTNSPTTFHIILPKNIK